jgi:hypothetical protein
MWRAGGNTRALRSRPFFDLVIEPGDLAADADRGATARLADAVRVPPVTLVEHKQALARESAAEALGLEPGRPTALVTLGAGTLDDVTAPATAAIRTLLIDPDWQIAVTRAHIALDGLPLLNPHRMVELRGVYPLARYLRAFDAAVSAADYNSFHELLLAGVPTLLVSNRAAATDDQTARASWAAEKGLALAADADDLDAVSTQAARVLDPAVRAGSSPRAGHCPRPLALPRRLACSLVSRTRSSDTAPRRFAPSSWPHGPRRCAPWDRGEPL